MHAQSGAGADLNEARTLRATEEYLFFDVRLVTITSLTERASNRTAPPSVSGTHGLEPHNAL
jgi:hypothetical protein